jgi:hypothetical protein
MQIGAVLVLAYLLIREREYLVDIVEAFGVNVSGYVSESAPSERVKLTVLGLRATQAGRSYPV